MADREAQAYNIGFSAMLADVATMGCISLSSIIRLTNYYLAFVLTSTSVFQIVSRSGQHNAEIEIFVPHLYLNLLAN
jgi:hypothetical protein